MESLNWWVKLFIVLWLYIKNFFTGLWNDISQFLFRLSIRLGGINFNPIDNIKNFFSNPLKIISNIDFNLSLILTKIFISLPFFILNTVLNYIIIPTFNFIAKTSIPFLINNILFTIFFTTLFLWFSYIMYKKKSWYYFKSVKLIRYIIKTFTLPAYALVVLNYNIIISMFNLTIRSYITSMWNDKFEEYKKKRKDKYFAYFGFIFIFISFVLFSGLFDRMFYFLNEYIFNYRNVFDDMFYYLYIYNDYIEIGRNLFIFHLFFVPIEKFLFQKYYADIDLKPPLLVKKFLRWFARKQGKIYIGTVSNKVKKEFKTNNPFKKHIFLSDEQRSLHTDVAGTTGTGKSASMIFPWFFQDIKRNRGGIIIDAKGDLDFFDKINSYQKKHTDNDNTVKLINLADKSFSNSYNPILRGNATEIKDRIMGAFRWENEYYKAQAEKTLIILLKATEHLNKKLTFHDLYVLLTDKQAVKGLLSKVTSDLIADQIDNEILNDFQRMKEETTGLRNNIYMLAYGDGDKEGLDEVINTYNPDIDFLESYKNNEIVYITLPTNLIGQTARAFGKMLLMDLKSTGGYIEQNQIERKFYPVFIDEFAEFATEEFVGWLNKARSSGFRIHIAHQSLGDLEQVNDSFVKQVVDNTNIKMVFRMNDSNSVENYVSQLGTFKTVKETERVSKNLVTQEEDNVGSLRETDEFIVSPNTIKNLKQGQAMIFGRHPDTFQTIVNTDYLPDIEPVKAELVKAENKFDGLNIDKIKEEFDKDISKGNYQVKDLGNKKANVIKLISLLKYRFYNKEEKEPEKEKNKKDNKFILKKDSIFIKNKYYYKKKDKKVIKINEEDKISKEENNNKGNESILEMLEN